MHHTYPHCYISHSVTEQPNSKHFERHCHNMYELLFVLRGEGSYIVEGTQYPLRANTLMLLRPQEYHYVCPQESAPYERYVINFDDSIPIDATASLPFLSTEEVNTRGIYFSSRRLTEQLLPLFHSLQSLSAFSQEEPLAAARGEALVRGAVTQILLLLSLSSTADAEASTNSLISRVIDTLNAHLGEDISLDRLSQDFFISKFHLCRMFREHTGMPLMTYLTTKRISLAQQLLSDGMSANEVALRVGFGDYSAFYRAFRKQTGHAPAWSRGTAK